MVSRAVACVHFVYFIGTRLVGISSQVLWKQATHRKTW